MRVADHGQDRVGQDIPGLPHTPLGATDLLAGDLMWIAFRATLLSLLFVAVIILLSAAASPLVVLAVPVAVLTALSFAARSWPSPPRRPAPADSMPVPIRHHSAVPVLGNLLPHREAAPVHAAAGLDHPTYHGVAGGSIALRSARSIRSA